MLINLTPLTLAKPAVNGGTERVDLLADTLPAPVTRTINTARRIALDNFSRLITRPILTAVTQTGEVKYQKLTTDKHELMLSNNGTGEVTLLVIVNTVDDRRWVSVNFRIENDGGSK